ncbi:isoprenyl transferase [Sporolactobacillus spathodeae]|uniref:Isoprenyl transferase n=1 Tax=Sporolactobacillus spathodeae TaxID=1465502 RepID=A0ABS2Q5C3_9BACL|nr:isoprenyl transferase [Sporolactobacillus spathodeae]MBM7656978.1 undecaprenyl diphosphate synthase [Sporolactobacillus spathodeae]
MFGKFSLNKKGNSELPAVNPSELSRIPEHVAIIMDGNGRWAQRRGLPRIAGHREAMKTVKRITAEAQHLGVKVLTLYTFSTENWKRPKAEVDFLMKLPEQFLHSYLVELKKNNVQVQVMGDLSIIPEHTLLAVNQAISETKNNSGLILNFALNYGSYAELTQAIKRIAQDVLDRKLAIDAIDVQAVSARLLNPELPAPDLLIRTGGELRLSNFMLWQLAYTELYFTDVYWPDFAEEDLRQAIHSFSERQRRYGGLNGGGTK